MRNSGNIVEPIVCSHLRARHLADNKSSQNSISINNYYKLQSVPPQAAKVYMQRHKQELLYQSKPDHFCYFIIILSLIFLNLSLHC